MSDQTQREWNHAKLLSVFTGLLVLIGIIYSIATILQWRSINQQARLMSQQLEIMKGQIDDAKLTRSADLIIRFDERLTKPPNLKIETTIGRGKPVLKRHAVRLPTTIWMGI